MVPAACLRLCIPPARGPAEAVRGQRRDVARRRPQDELRPVLSGKARRLLRLEREENAERWLGARKQRPKFHFTVRERRRLKVFFDDLDEDGSGHVTVEELLGPLLAFGLADDEARRLVQKAWDEQLEGDDEMRKEHETLVQRYRTVLEGD